MTAHDQSNSGNADGFAPHDLVNSEGAVCVYILTSTLTMTLLLTTDHTTLFFYTLCPSSQCHGMSVEHWQTSVEMKFNSGSKVP